MKRLLFATLVIVSLQVSAQKMDAAKVPATVKATFAKAYPKATATWELEDKNYEAGFKQDGKTITVVIDTKGTLLETETDITMSDLPKAAAEYLSVHYKGKKVKETAKIVKANGEVNYEAEVNKVDVIFDSKGGFLKEVKG